MAERADLDELARRYLDLWQDQMTALAGDKEFAETVQRLMTTMGLAATAAPEFWRAWPATMAGLQAAEQTQGASDDQSRATGPSAPTRSAEGSAAGTAARTAAPCRAAPEGIGCHVFAAAAPPGGGGIANGSRPRRSATGRS